MPLRSWKIAVPGMIQRIHNFLSFTGQGYEQIAICREGIILSSLKIISQEREDSLPSNWAMSEIRKYTGYSLAIQCNFCYIAGTFLIQHMYLDKNLCLTSKPSTNKGSKGSIFLQSLPGHVPYRCHQI